jgi:hypothetical protein
LHSGYLDEDLVDQLHFGGGEDDPTRNMTKKEIYEQVIAKSKKAKYVMALRYNFMIFYLFIFIQQALFYFILRLI